jgi:hypothetical protein
MAKDEKDGIDRRKVRSGKLRGLRVGNWPIAAAVVASLLLVLTLPQNSTVLADQIVAGQVRSMAMFASAWLYARAEVQDGVSRVALLHIHRLLNVTI